MFEDLLEANSADCGTKNSRVRDREIDSSNADFVTNLICKQHHTYCFTLNKCQ